MRPLNFLLRRVAPAWLAMLGFASAQAATVSYPLNLSAGWNLAGNSLASPLNVKTTFGAQSAVATVWKWNAASGVWSFYAPSLDSNGTLAAYAAARGYEVLTTVNPGDGYWVNASAALSLGNQTGAGFSLAAGKLSAGWNLVATGDLLAPAALTTTIGNVKTLWAWDNGGGGWYFHAPTLATDNTLASYVQAKGYKDFGAMKLGNGMGFWVNYAGAGSAGGTGGTGGTGTACFVKTPSLGAVESTTYQTRMLDGSTSIFTQSLTFAAVNGDAWTTTDSWGMTAVNVYACNQVALVSNNTGFSTDSYDPPLKGLPSSLDVGFSETLSTTQTSVSFGTTCTGTKTYMFEVLAAESVTVPAGTFNTLKIRRTDNAYTLNCSNKTTRPVAASTSTAWEAAQLGLVKSQQADSVMEMLSGGAPAVASVAVTPTSLSTLVGSMETFAATASYVGISSTENVTYTATWSSSNPTVATVDKYGLVSALAIGTAEITATVGGVSSSATLTVAEVPVIQEPIPISGSATDTAQSMLASEQDLFSIDKNYFGLEWVLNDLGFGIRYPDGSVSGEATQRILFDKWNVDAIESALHKGVSVTLDDYVVALQMAIQGAVSGTLPPDAPAVDVPLRTRLLDALRAAAKNKEPAFASVRDTVHLIVALGRERAVGAYDLLDPAVPGTAPLDAVQTALLTQRLAAELWSAAQQFKPATVQMVPGKAVSTLPPKGTVAAEAAPAPCSMGKTEGYVMDGFAAGTGMAFGGVSVGDESVIKGIFERVGEGAEKYASSVQVANIALNYAKLLWAAIAFKADMSVNPSPLVRTKTRSPGAVVTVGATFTLDIGNAQILNCIRPALNLAGIDFSAPQDGPLSGSRVEWFVDENIFVKTGYNPVYNSDWGVVETIGGDLLHNTTDVNGHNEIQIQGKPQKTDLTARNADGSKKKLVCVDRRIKVIAQTNLKNNDMKQDGLDLLGAASGIGALATLPIGILERMPSKLFEGKVIVPVKDFEVIEGDVFLVNAEYKNPSEGTISNVSDQVTATLQTKCDSYGQCTGAVMQVRDKATSYTTNLCENEEILGTEEKFTYDGGGVVRAYYDRNATPVSGTVSVSLSGTAKAHGLSAHSMTCACDDDPVAPSTGKTMLSFSFNPFEFVAGASSITVDQTDGNGAGWTFTIYKPDDLVDGDICLP